MKVCHVRMDGVGVSWIMEVPVDASRLAGSQFKDDALNQREVPVTRWKLSQQGGTAQALGQLPNGQRKWRVIS
jgi:hypothetical protein